MSNIITAYFKGRTGVCESVYQYDYGRVLVLDGVDLGESWLAYFDVFGEEDALTAIGSEDRVAIPDACLAESGNVKVHIPTNAGDNDSEIEYVVSFKVIGRARPEDYEATDEQRSLLTEAIALVRTAWSRWKNITANAITLEPGSDATAEYEDGVLTLGIPEGHGVSRVWFDAENCLNLELTNGATATSDPVIQRIALDSVEYTKTATLTSSVNSVALDMTGYVYSVTDTIIVYINGLMAVPTQDYTISVSGGVATITFTMAAPVSEDVFIRVLKTYHT